VTHYASCLCACTRLSLFFFHPTATTEIYTLSLHDALPICDLELERSGRQAPAREQARKVVRQAQVQHVLHRQVDRDRHVDAEHRSEEHTSELQSLAYLVCRLLLEKKKKDRHSDPHQSQPVN